MSTSSVDSNRKAQNASKTREQAKQQEAQLKKKHAEEVNRLQKMHGEKVREMQQAHEQQLESVRTRGQGALSDKDRKYQDEINKIKNTHTQATINSKQNHERNVRQIQSGNQAQLEKTEQVYDSQMNSLSKNYETDLSRKEKTFTAAVDEMRDGQQEALHNQKERLEGRYTKDQNILSNSRDKKINELTNQLQTIREQKNAEIKGLKVQNMSDRQKSQENTMDIVTQERKTHGLHSENMRDQYADNLDELREKYGTYNRESRSGRALELENMKTMAEQRNTQQVGTLERRIREIKSNHDNQRFVDHTSFRDEKKEYLTATKEALQKAEQQRSMVVDAANARTASEIKDINSRNAEILDRQGKYYQGRLGEMEIKYDESVENQVKGLAIENRLDKLKGDQRTDKLTYLLTKEKNDLEGYYKEMLSEKDRIHKDAMVEQRMNMLKERNQAVGKLEDRLREVDAKNTEKMNQLIMRYEREHSYVRDEHKAEKKRMVEHHNRRIEELEKGHKFQLESEKLSAKNREDQMKAKFERNISQIEVKHDEEKIRMATLIKK